jgi:hypothetical protein
MFSFDPDREAEDLDLDLVAIEFIWFSEAALREGKGHPRINRLCLHIRLVQGRKPRLTKARLVSVG